MATKKILLALLAGVLAACAAAGDDGGASDQAEPARLGTPSPVSAPGGSHVSWRERVAAEVEALSAAEPDRYAELAGLAPSPTRAGFLRFTSDLDDPRIAAVFLDRLAGAREPVEVRAALAEALPRTGGVFADALLDLLAAEPDPQAREALVGAAARAPAAHALAVLSAGLSDAHALVRAEAARAAAAHPEGGRLADELMVVLADRDAAVRTEAARTLGVKQAAGALDAVTALLADGDAEVRLHALRALERIDPTWVAARPEVAGLAADPDPRVARLAASLRELAQP